MEMHDPAHPGEIVREECLKPLGLTKTVPRHRHLPRLLFTWSAFILWLPDRRPPSHECSRNRAFMHYAPSNAARARLGDLEWMGRQCLAVHFGGGKAEVSQRGGGDVDQ